MEQIPSSEANRCSASQKFPAFYGTCRFITVFTTATIHPNPKMNQSSPHQFYLFIIHFNIIPIHDEDNENIIKLIPGTNYRSRSLIFFSTE